MSNYPTFLYFHAQNKYKIMIYVYYTIRTRPVVTGGAGRAMAPQDFGRSNDPISTKGGGQIMTTK